MFFFLPPQLIVLCTFPGVVLHEIAHRFFCDINNIEVYAIDYFSLEETRSGFVLHKNNKNFWANFFIGIGPLIVNSLACMLFTIPYGFQAYLETLVVKDINYLYCIMSWIGFSIGFHAFPSNQDLSDLNELADTIFKKLVAKIFTKIFSFLNKSWFSLIFRFAYIILLSLIIPRIVLGDVAYPG